MTFGKQVHRIGGFFTGSVSLGRKFVSFGSSEVAIGFARSRMMVWVSFGAWAGGFTGVWEEGNEGNGLVGLGSDGSWKVEEWRLMTVGGVCVFVCLYCHNKFPGPLSG